MGVSPLMIDGQAEAEIPPAPLLLLNSEALAFGAICRAWRLDREAWFSANPR
jgi:hypothetical protein